jgi:hypothetical protein
MIKDAVTFHVSNLNDAMERLASYVTSEAQSGNMTWPFITVRGFEVVGAAARLQSGVERVEFTPIVRRMDADKWAQHSAETFDLWFEESSRTVLSNRDSELTVSDYLPSPVIPFLYDMIPPQGNESKGEAIMPSMNNSNAQFFVPISLQTPPPFASTTINFNVLSVGPCPHLGAATGAREGVFTGILNVSGTIGFSVREEDHERYHSNLVDWDKSLATSIENPHSLFARPIFQHVYGYKQAGGSEHSSDYSLGDINGTSPPLGMSPVVGYLSAVIAWDRYFVSLLPQGVDGITAVLANDCHQEYTYFIQGDSVSVAGRGAF